MTSIPVACSRLSVNLGAAPARTIENEPGPAILKQATVQGEDSEAGKACNRISTLRFRSSRVTPLGVTTVTHDVFTAENLN